MSYLILHVNDEEWVDVKLDTKQEIPKEVYYVGLCKDEDLE